jgi:hypothetical protein
VLRRLTIPALAILFAVAAFGRDASAQTPAPTPAPTQIVGALPAGGGFAGVVWGGGTVDPQLVVASRALGCALVSAWLANQGVLVQDIPGAPSFVNAPFLKLFPAGMLPPNSIVIVVCAAPFSDTRTIAGCPLFPDDNPWATDISSFPVHPLSDRYIGSILASGGNRNLHADFGSNPDYGIPYVIVPPNQATVPVSFDYADESDVGPYPIPAGASIEAGSDRHMLVVRQGECRLYELFDAQLTPSGWHAGSGAIFDLRSNALRPDGWTSADAAGLPILPGLVRLDEVRAGAINHALRFTISRTQRAYIHPATHLASSISDPSVAPMGLRLRLRADFDLSRFHGESLVILTALKRYGMFVADNGANWFITGATDSGWDDEDLNQLKTVPGSAFEAVDTGPVITAVR